MSKASKWVRILNEYKLHEKLRPEYKIANNSNNTVRAELADDGSLKLYSGHNIIGIDQSKVLAFANWIIDYYGKSSDDATSLNGAYSKILYED